jgi:hypothetical protein
MASAVKLGPKIYAEFLPNVRSVSLAIELSSPSVPSTEIRLCQKPSKDGPIAQGSSHVSVKHQGAEAHMVLPAAIRPPGQLQLASASDALQQDVGTVLPVVEGQRGKTQLTWRLPLAPNSAISAVSGYLDDYRSVPWSALSLRPGAGVYCRQCGVSTVIVPPGRIQSWKDLPDQGWAEMMEFWHCHKPQVSGPGHAHGSDAQGEKASEEQLADRGYGANMRIAPSPGLALVDLTTIWLSEDDCEVDSVRSSHFLFILGWA